MATIRTKGKYHIALGANGLMLNTPQKTGVPAYRVDQSPSYGNRFAQGDRSYNDLSRWWYFSQTDWQGGFTDFPSWEDTATFYYSTNIDARSQPGAFRLERQITSVRDNTANGSVLDVKRVVYNGSENVVYLDEDQPRTLSSGSALFGSSYGSVPSFQMSHRNYYWAFFDGTSHSSTNGALVNYDGTTESNKASQINSIIDGSAAGFDCGVAIGDTLYVFGYSSTDKAFCVKTTVANPASSADWTLVFEVGNYGAPEWLGAELIGSNIVGLIGDLDVWNLVSISPSTGVITPIQSFNADQMGNYDGGSRYVTKFRDGLLITICTDSSIGGGSVWLYDGNSLTKIYSTDDKKASIGQVASAYLRGGCVVYGDFAFWGNLVYDGISFFNSIRANADSETVAAIPVGQDPSSGLLYFVDTIDVSGDDQLIVYSYNGASTASMKTGASNSAYMVFSNHDVVSGIDKLAYSVTINHEPLATGQSIEVQYTTGELSASPSWTSLGTISNSVDGGTITSKKFLFGNAITFKKIWVRVLLASTTSGSPAVTDLIMEYLPLPNQTKTWQINVNCANEIMTLDGKALPMTGRELRQILESLWYQKQLLEYQDIDYAETQLNGSLTSSATTITVDDTTDLPEQGRITIDNEEILYAGKTQLTLTGCTRGARGSTAAAHTDNTAVRTGYYRILITDLSAEVPVLLKDKEIESTVALTLRESSVA